MLGVLLLLLSLASPICCQFKFQSASKPNNQNTQTRLGLLSTDLGLPPVPLGSHNAQNVGGNLPIRENPSCNYHQGCCCVERYQCQSQQGGHDGAGIIDIRIVNNPGSGSQNLGCRHPLVQCCPTSQPINPINPYCSNGDQCCCVRRGTCTSNGYNNDGSGIIDIRVRPTRNRQCRRNQEFCCAEQGTQPRPQPPYRPEPTYPSSGQNNLRPLNGNDCGYSQPYTSGGYQGGYGQADFGEYNFLVVILTPDNVFVGSGALLSPTTVITADHKVFNQTARYLKVRAREWNAGADEEPLSYIEVSVNRIISHHNSNVRYSQLTNLKNDVAILQLAQPISFQNEYVGSICLPPQGTQFTGQTCWVAGWGKDSFGPEGQYQQILKEVDVSILSSHQCQNRLRNTRLGHNFQFDDHSFICAGGQRGKDACEGDGGAPLMCNIQGRWYLAGLVAWGIGCAQPEVPGVYVNVPSFSNWINQNSGYGGNRG